MYLMTPYEALSQNIDDIRQKLTEQETMLHSLNRGEQPCAKECCMTICPHKQRLSKVLLETIEVLDATKKSFKSKQLEILRKRLIQELAEHQ